MVIDHRTKTDIAAHALRHAITSGELRPGDRIRADEWSQRLSLSATPVREALRILEAEGLLEIHPHRGASVIQISREELVEVYRMRAALESLAVVMLIEKLSEEERRELVKQLAELLETFRREGERGDREAARMANKEFHTLLYSRGAGPRLLAQIANLWAVSPFETLMLVLGHHAAAVVEHEEIWQAVRDGDATRAEQAMKRHIEVSVQRILDSPFLDALFR